MEQVLHTTYAPSPLGRHLPSPAECGALFRFSSLLNSTVETIDPVESKGVATLNSISSEPL